MLLLVILLKLQEGGNESEEKGKVDEPTTSSADDSGSVTSSNVVAKTVGESASVSAQPPLNYSNEQIEEAKEIAKSSMKTFKDYYHPVSPKAADPVCVVATYIAKAEDQKAKEKIVYNHHVEVPL